MAALVLIGLISWLITDINKRTGAIQEIKKETSFRFKAVETLASLKKDQRDAAAQKVSLSVMLPIQDKLINFPKDLNALAKKNDVDLGFSFGQELAGTDTVPGHISFTITASASFNNWLKFVEALENSRYMVSFDSFNLAGTEDKFQSVINAKVFSQ